MPNARVSAAGGALPPVEAITPGSPGPGSWSPLDIITMPSGDPFQIALTTLRRHTAALTALRFGAEAELAANIFARAELEGLIERLISALDAVDGDENLEPDLAGSDPKDEDREGVAENTQLSPYGFQRSLTQFDEDYEDDGTAEDDGTTEPSLGWPENRVRQMGCAT